MPRPAELIEIATGLLRELRLSEAEQCLRQAVALDPDSVSASIQLGRLALWNGRLDEAAEWFRHALEKGPPSHVEGYLPLASLYERSGMRDAAIHLCRSGIARNPEASSFREHLCALLARIPDYPAALQEALEIASRRGLYTDYLRLGSYAVALRRIESAERAFQAAVERNPAAWEGHYNLGELYMGVERKEDAREHYQAALDRTRGAYEPLNGMGLFVLLVEQDCDRAIALLEQARRLAPSRPEPQWNLALAYAQKREFSAARKFAASVMEMMKPGDPLRREAERLLAVIRIETRSFQSLR